MEIVEEFINGFCKAQNQSRMVLCEFQVEEDGTRTFLESDCAYGTCSHSRQCQLMAGVSRLHLRSKSLNEPANVAVNGAPVNSNKENVQSSQNIEKIMSL